jgi:hypothetical protein
MKTKIFKLNFFALILIGLLFSGCSLDEQLYGVATTEGFVKTEADANFVVNGVYAGLQGYEAYKSCIGSIVMYAGDDLTGTTYTGNNAGVYIMRRFTSTQPYLLSAWNSYYSVINRANSAMESIDPVSSINSKTKTKIDGEMYFLRGFCHFNLVRLFGAIPISITATKPNENLHKPRQAVDSVYSQIFKDFQLANQKCVALSKQPSTELGRATKGAAQAMLSLAYLTYGNYCDLNGKTADAQINYQQAANWADSVLLSNEYTLISNYADLFDVTKEKSAYKEVIFGIQFTRDNLQSAAASRGSEWTYNTQPAERWGVTGGNLPKGNGNGSVKLQPWFVEQYFTGEYSADYRSEVSFLTRWSGYDPKTSVAYNYFTFPATSTVATDKSQQQPYLNKYIDGKGLDSRNHENDLFIIRLSEVYLIKAEALNELDKTTEAYIPFNELRKRARLANGTARTTPIDLAAGLDKENFRLAVFNERGLELVGEGHRYFDCVRMRYPNTNTTMLQWRYETFYPNLLATQKALPKWNSTTKTWSEGRVLTDNVQTWDIRYLLLPIPSGESDANPMIFNNGLFPQNQGW